MNAVVISSIKESQVPECLKVMAHAYLTNPINSAALGGGNVGLSRNKRFFRLAMKVFRGEMLVATTEGRVLGMLGYTEYPHCFPSRWRMVSLVPEMVYALGSATSRVFRWLSAWGEVHPRESHCHLGPVAVFPEFQGKGVGKKLMEHYCAHLDNANEAGYLETDKPENVTFYGKFGFEVIRELPVLGVATWLMERRAVPSS